jgi:hypothetical protein
MAGLIYLRGPTHWLMAATLGAVPVSIMALMAGGMLQQHLSMIAFIGAVAGIAMWSILRRARLIA